MRISERKFYFKSQKKIICIGLLLMLVFCGVVLGTILICKTDNLKFYNRLLFNHNIFKSKINAPFFIQFIRSFISAFVLLFVQFFSGYFAFGQVIAVFTVIYRGVASAVSIAFIYIMLGIKGIFAAVIMALPFAASTIFVMILGAREAIRQSNSIADYSFLKGTDDDSLSETKLYLIKFSVLTFFVLCFSIIDTALMCFLGDFFFPVKYQGVFI